MRIFSILVAVAALLVMVGAVLVEYSHAQTKVMILQTQVNLQNDLIYAVRVRASMLETQLAMAEAACGDPRGHK